MKTATRAMLGLTLAVSLCAHSAAQGTGYPDKPVRMVVGYPPGQTVDIIARSYAAAMSKELGQTVIVDNKAGANGIIGAQEVKRAPADGYTLLFGTSGQLTINPALYRPVPYDPLKDFTPVSLVSTGALFLVAHPSFPPNNVAEFIAYAKQRPGEVNYGSGGQGITAHLAMEIFEAQAGLKLVHVPYKGSPAATTDLIGGRISVMFDAGPSALPHVKAGRMKVLGVSGLKRSPVTPQLATIDEQGLKGFEVTSWVGIVAPAGTPEAVINKLNAAIRRASSNPQLLDALTPTGLIAINESPAQFGSFMKTEVDKWAGAVAKAGVRLDQ